MRRELVRGRNDSRYEQFETAPEIIGPELRPAVCKQQQTDRQTDLRRIIA